MLPLSALNAIAHNLLVPKEVVEKFCLNELEHEKVKFFELNLLMLEVA